MPELTRDEKIEAMFDGLRKTGRLYESAIDRIRTFIRSQHAMTTASELPAVVLAFLETPVGARMFNVEAVDDGTSQIRTALALYGVQGRAADKVIGEIGPDIGDVEAGEGGPSRAPSMAHIIALRVEHDPLFAGSWASRADEPARRARAAVDRAVARGYVDPRADLDALASDRDIVRHCGGPAGLADAHIEKLMTSNCHWSATFAPGGEPAARDYEEDGPTARRPASPMPADARRAMDQVNHDGADPAFAEIASEMMGEYERM